MEGQSILSPTDCNTAISLNVRKGKKKKRGMKGGREGERENTYTYKHTKMCSPQKTFKRVLTNTLDRF